jgi:2-(1,2-epoxy-1,2-dihydrophenyl)acetyl-CoA isomerase
MNEPESHFEVANGVGVFTLNRPKALNAISPAMFARDLPDMVQRAQGDAALRALILTGAGGNFCSGADVKRMGGATPQTPEERDAGLRRTLDWIYRLANLRCPVIAAVDGIAFGGGFSLALTADIILATPRTRFCLVFGRIGLIPDMGAASLLTRVIGPQRTKELAFSARSFGAEEAMALGIVHAIHEPCDVLAAARTLAQRLAKGSPTAIAQAKHLIDTAIHGDQAQMIEAELAAQNACRDTGFHREAVRRFATKEPALYNWDATATHTDSTQFSIIDRG